MSERERESVYVAVGTQISRVLLKMEHLKSVQLSLSHCVLFVVGRSGEAEPGGFW